jgi:NADH-quinone oxidoreductase subunit F
VNGKVVFDVKQALQRTNGDSLRSAREMGPEKTIELITRKGLKGRGGAGNATGKKWAEVRAQPAAAGEKYFVVNCDEGEPGTFKDRFILENNSETLIEGIQIACFAIGARKAFVYVRGEYSALARDFDAKAKAAKTSVPIEVVVGAGAYVVGEQTAMLNSIEGRRGTPRLKPPFPATYGLYGKPTVVNNVETVLNAALLFRGDWNGALHLFSVSGNVRKPGVYERALGVKLGDLLRDAEPSEAPKAVFFGASGGCVKYDASLALSQEGVAKTGASLGSCTLVVVGEKQSVPEVCLSLARFFEHESCGNCAPCREITGMLRKRFECAVQAKRFGSDVKPLLEESRVLMRTASLCGLGQSALTPLVQAVSLFPQEFK